MMLRRGVLAVARKGCRQYATEGKPPGSTSQPRPSQTDSAQAAAQRKEAEARKAAELHKAEEAKRAEAKRAEELKKAEAAKKAELERQAAEAKQAEAAKKAEEAKKAAELKQAEEAKKAEDAKKAQEATKAEQAKTQDAEKATEETSEVEEVPAKSLEVQNQELSDLLAKQQAILQRMAEDIEIARGERKLQRSINGEVQIKDISRILQNQVKERVDGVKKSARDAVTNTQESINKSGVLAIEAAAEQRKNLSRLNREQQLPWQKDRPKALYIETGKWFLKQQQGIEAPIWMTALEAGVIFAVFLFWYLQRRRTRNKQAAIDGLLQDMNEEVDKARDTLHTAREVYNRDVLKKEDELREMQSYSSEQSVTIDSLTRVLHEAEQ